MKAGRCIKFNSVRISTGHLFYASALVLGAICIWSFSRLHPFFSSNCDWDMVLYLKSHYAGYYDATTLHVAAHTILRIRDFLSLFTSERMSLVVLFGLFHLSSVALSGLLAYRLFNSLFAALAFTAIYSVHPCIQFLLSSFEDNLFGHPFVLMALIFTLPDRPFSFRARSLAACSLAMALLVGTSNLIYFPLVGIFILADCLKDGNRWIKIAQRMAHFAFVFLAAFTLFALTIDLLNNNPYGDSITALIRSFDFAGAWMREDGKAGFDRLTFYPAGAYEIKLSAVDQFLFAPAQSIYSVIALNRDWPELFTELLTQPMALLFISTTGYRRWLYLAGFWFYAGQTLCLLLIMKKAFNNGLREKQILTFALLMQMLVAFAFLALYRDNSYERYDFYIVIFPIIGYVFYQGNLVWHTGKFRINAGRIILYVTCACFMFTAAVFFYRYNSFSNVYRIGQNHPGDFNAYFYSTSDLNTLNQYIALRLMDVHPIQIVVTEPPILPPDATDNRYMLPFKVVTPELLNEIAKQEDIFISEALLNWMKQAKERH